MKLRMYLRGLGIGIVVTALIMGLTTAKANKIPDSEIIKRAEALGMVKEDTSIKSIAPEPKEEPKAEEPKKEEPKAEEPKKEEPKAEEPKKEEPKAEEPKKEEPKAEEPKAEEPKAEEPKAEEPKEEKPADTAVVTTGIFTLEIAGGTGSETVAALLERGGVIKSAADFDEYLCNNGYDHRITTGKHVIPAGSDYETIAKIITSR